MYISKTFIIKNIIMNAFQRISTHFNAFQRISTHFVILTLLMLGLQSELQAQPYSLYDCDGINPIELDESATHCASCSSIEYPPSSVCAHEVESRVYASPLAGQGFCYPEIQAQHFYLHIEVYFQTGQQTWTPIMSGTASINNPFEIRFRTGESGYYRYKITCKTTNGSSDPKDHTTLGCYQTEIFSVNVSGFPLPADFTTEGANSSQSNSLIPYVACNSTVLAEWNHTMVPSYYNDCWSAFGSFCQYKWVTYLDGVVYNDPGFTSGLPPQLGEDLSLPVLQTSGHIITLELQLMRDGCSSSSSVDFYYLGEDGTDDLPIDFRVSSFFVNEYDLDSDIVPGGDCTSPAFIGGSISQPYVSALPHPRMSISSFDIEVFEFDDVLDCQNDFNSVKVAYHNDPNMVWNSSIQNYLIEGASPPGPYTGYWTHNTFNGDERWKLELDLEVQCEDNEFITLSCSTIFKVRPEDIYMLPEDPSHSSSFADKMHAFSAHNENLDVVLRQRLPKTKSGELHVFDVKGKPVVQLKDINTSSLQLHHQFAPGMYFYYFSDSKIPKTVSGKIIIVR
jgi:hypothetical protein